MWCTGLALVIVQIHRDGIALDGVNVHAVAQLRGQFTAVGATANHHGVSGLRLEFRFFCIHQLDPLACGVDAGHIAVIDGLHTHALERL